MNSPRAAWGLLALACVACDALTPSAPPDATLLDGPIAGLTGAQTRLFLRGDAEFGRRFAFSEGLGPLFNAPSCDTCHPGDGRAHPEFGFLRFGRYGDDGRFDPMLDYGGPQLQDRAIPGYPPEALPARDDLGVTLLLAPPVTGLGLLEAVDDATLLALEDPEDRDGDGISGRVHWVLANDGLAEIAAEGDAGGGERLQLHGEAYVGRFGRKGSNISLLHQTVAAYNNDMGLTSDFAMRDPINVQVGPAATDGAPDPELTSATVQSVAFYLRTLRPPERRGAGNAAVTRGEALFVEIGCAACHLPSLPTGAAQIEALAGKEARAWTDLLLHDMGPELDDGYAEGDASPAEWRTAPLWGLGLAADSQGGQARYLHDGRAQTLTEAIAYHGGEGAGSRSRFEGLGGVERGQVLSFLESL